MPGDTDRHVKVVNDLGLFAFFVQHGLEEISKRIGSGGRYLLTFRDPDNLAPGLKRAYRDSGEHAHDGIVRRIYSELTQRKSERAHRSRGREGAGG